jgi:hypothetical protein
MEYGVVHSDLTDSEIKPKALINDYFKKVGAEFPALLANARKTDTCPSCEKAGAQAAFSKSGAAYLKCSSCLTLFFEKTPTYGDLLGFYHHSEARSFWLKEIWNHTAESRKSKVLRPLFDWITSHLEQDFGTKQPARLADALATNPGLIEVARDAKSFVTAKLIEPWFKTNLSSSELSWHEVFEGIVLNDVLGRSPSPKEMLSIAAEKLVPGGLCFLTAALSTGLDVLTLGADSTLATPPDHLILFSFDGLIELIEKTPFEILEFSTPGVLDVQNLKEASQARQVKLPAFFDYALNHRQDQEFANALQDLLQEYRLSSQARLVLKRK